MATDAVPNTTGCIRLSADRSWKVQMTSARSDGLAHVAKRVAKVDFTCWVFVKIKSQNFEISPMFFIPITHFRDFSKFWLDSNHNSRGIFPRIYICSMYFHVTCVLFSPCFHGKLDKLPGAAHGVRTLLVYRLHRRDLWRGGGKCPPGLSWHLDRIMDPQRSDPRSQA